MEAFRAFRGVGLGVIRWCGLNQGWVECALCLRVGMFLLGPLDQMIGQMDDIQARPAAFRQGTLDNLRRFEKIKQVLGAGGGKGFIDGLVRIPDPNPITLFTGQQREDLLLEKA